MFSRLVMVVMVVLVSLVLDCESFRMYARHDPFTNLHLRPSAFSSSSLRAFPSPFPSSNNPSSCNERKHVTTQYNENLRSSESSRMGWAKAREINRRYGGTTSATRTSASASVSECARGNKMGGGRNRFGLEDCGEAREPRQKVHEAVFCGFETTEEERMRLRSANIF